MIAARQIAFGGSAKRWENPYITDGLVAMWDGEWNAGFGKHTNDIADGWMNLVDGTIMSIPSVDDMYFGDSFLHRGLQGVLNTGFGIAEKNTTTEMVVEVLSENNTSTNGRFFGSSLSANRFEIDIPTNNPSTGPRLYYRLLGETSYRARSCYSGMTDWNRVWSIGYSIDGNGAFSVFDSVSGFSFANNDVIDDSFYASAKLLLGSWASGPTSPLGSLICKIRAVRRYSRVVSSEERAYNYNIDKARFNI